MKSVIAKLVVIANELDARGLKEEANLIDSLISEATDEKFDILVKAKVGVKASVYNSLGDMDEPPVASHVKAEATVTVNPIENGQVVQSKVLFTKTVAARNLQELKAKLSTEIIMLKQQFSPARMAEQTEYYPV